MMIPGVMITMGGKDWEVPPLTLGQLRRLMPKVRRMTNVDATMGEDQLTTVLEIVSAAMQRNYPEITVEMVEELLDLGNTSNVLSAVLTGSGLKLGEIQAVTGLNGGTYMDISPPPAGTVTQQ
jgi:hypothetical protein